MCLWEQWGYSSLHNQFGILYIDDILLNFRSWADAEYLLNDLRTYLAGYGLSISWRKSTIMSCQRVLDDGRRLVSQGSLLHGCVWGTSMKYLRRTWSHTDSSSDLTSKLFEQIDGILHGALGELQPVAKLQHWTRPFQAARFAMKFVASRFLWFAPLLEPLVLHRDRILTMQTTSLVGLLKLYLPDDLTREVALELNRFRRRVAKLVGIRYADSWLLAWLTRRWTYVGHLLRYAEEHVTQQAVLAFSGARSRGRPRQTLLAWACKLAAQLYGREEAVSVAELRGLAADRATWSSKTSSIKEFLGDETSLYHSSIWSRPSRIFVLQIQWLHALLLTSEQQGFRVHWVSAEHGLMHYTIETLSYVEVISFLRHVQMTSNALAFPTFVDVDLQETIVLATESLCKTLFQELSVVWSFEVVSQREYAHLRHKLVE